MTYTCSDRIAPGFEYYRRGTLSLYAALDVRTGKVQGKTAARHSSAEFITFLTEVVEENPQPREIQIVLDNLSAHKTSAVKEFLDKESSPALSLHPDLFVIARC
ncbi:MAG TPA: transposase [Bryobacteraceae bacterium]|nr:transposase [Bryobacteraceae bacterium]